MYDEKDVKKILKGSCIFDHTLELFVLLIECIIIGSINYIWVEKL